MSDYLVVVSGLNDLQGLENLDKRILMAAQRAINRTADRGRTQAAREIQKQVAFTARYLSSGNPVRLRVSRKASENSLEAAIMGRDRPTSLARFAKDRNPKTASKRGGVNVVVKPGQAQFMKGAFLMQLRNGNLGLAVRLKDGETVRGKKFVTKVGKGLYLLFGPSVNQVFASVSEEEVAPAAADFLEAEFLRLLKL